MEVVPSKSTYASTTVAFTPAGSARRACATYFRPAPHRISSCPIAHLQVHLHLPVPGLEGEIAGSRLERLENPARAPGERSQQRLLLLHLLLQAPSFLDMVETRRSEIRLPRESIPCPLQARCEKMPATNFLLRIRSERILGPLCRIAPRPPRYEQALPGRRTISAALQLQPVRSRTDKPLAC